MFHAKNNLNALAQRSNGGKYCQNYKNTSSEDIMLNPV